jgi:hypothetical protein
LLREHPNSREDGQPATGMSYLTNEMSIDEIVDSSDIPESLVSNTQKLIDGASAKFVNYQSAKKVLLFNFVNSNLTTLELDWWNALFALVTLSNGIDEIWTTFNYEDNYWNFERVL